MGWNGLECMPCSVALDTNLTRLGVRRRRKPALAIGARRRSTRFAVAVAIASGRCFDRLVVTRPLGKGEGIQVTRPRRDPSNHS
jgi:hypothetical protein